MRLIAIPALLAAALAAGSASGQAATRAEQTWWGSMVKGNTLYDQCQEEIPRACVAYIYGVVDSSNTLRIVRIMMKQPVGAPCFAAGITGGQMVDIVRNYLAAHPEKRHLGADGLVLASMQEAFPCPH